MAFRDDSDALRARIDVLERELAIARRRLEELEGASEERDRLRARVGELERELGRRAPKRAKRMGAPSREARIAFATIGGIVALGVALAVATQSGGGRGSAPEAAAPIAAGAEAPSIGMIDLDATPDPAPVRLRVTGTTPAPTGCRGHVEGAPQLVLRSAHPTAVRIAPVAESGDLVLVVRAADGRTICDDDSGGSLNPLVSGVLPPGDTRVWVGTYADDVTIEASLVVHGQRADALPGGATASLAVLEGPPGSGRWEGQVATFEPASQSDPACRGYLPASPQLVLRLTERAAVRIDATGAQDLVLLVREPDGTVRCDDDSGPGAAPRIATLLVPGEHRVYVGTYSQSDAPVSFTLETAAHAIDPSAPPALGARSLAGPGAEVRLEGLAAAELAPSAIGASCAGGLVGVEPHAALELAQPVDVSLALVTAEAPFLVVQHPDRSFDCVRSASSRTAWAAGTHRIWVGVADDRSAAPFSLVARAEPPSVRPWAP